MTTVARHCCAMPKSTYSASGASVCDAQQFRKHAGGVLNICAANARKRVATAAASRPAALPEPERSSLLARATAFLPQLAAANARLPGTAGANDSIHVEPADHASDTDGDSSDDNAGPRIEMDLACGVLELHDAAARAAAEAAAGGATSGTDSSDTESAKEGRTRAPAMVQELHPVGLKGSKGRSDGK